MAFLLAFAVSGFIASGSAQPQTIDQVMSLKEVPIPVPMAAIIPVVTAGVNPIPGPGADLNFQPLAADLVKDQAALVRLGKALFWDMQVGSDGIQACATCHFNAGADIRTKNQISPGLNDTNFNGPIGGDNSFGNSTVPYTANDPNTPLPPGPISFAPWWLNVQGYVQFGPNYTLSAKDFPLNDWLNPTLLVPRGPGVTLAQELADVSRDTNDVVSSQGLRRTRFTGVTPGSYLDQGMLLPDIFNLANPGQLSSAARTRRCEPRNAPTTINAVFNYDNFWDGRASYVFNGVNPFGFRDRNSTLKKNMGGVLKDMYVRVINSSLASQAVGPPLSPFEMSYDGRTFPDLGKKMLTLMPLGRQWVHPQDSVLGGLSRAVLKPDGTFGGYRGLSVSYVRMIADAFKPQWWNHDAMITVGANQYTHMEYNFSLFFGLAVQAYEATLVSDDTPFDRYMGAPSKAIAPNPYALNDQQRLGLSVFLDDTASLGTHCSDCHVLPETTGHTVLQYQPDSQGVPSLSTGEAIEVMLMGDNLETGNYDHGMYNIGVRRSSEDIGRGGTSPFLNTLTGKNFPLSLVELAALRQAGQLPPDVARFVPNVPILPRRVTKGAFKAPNLRNVKFTGPYLHNGDSATLRQVVEFYTRGGNFPNSNLHDLSPHIEGIPPLMFPETNHDAQTRVQALVAFLAEGLTDQRVAYEKAPFDHPEIYVPNGCQPNNPDQDILMRIPAVGVNGRATKIPTFLNLDPQQP